MSGDRDFAREQMISNAHIDPVVYTEESAKPLNSAVHVGFKAVQREMRYQFANFHNKAL